MATTQQKQSSPQIPLKTILLTLVIAVALFSWTYGKPLYDLYTGKTPMFSVKAEIKVGEEMVQIERRVPCLPIAYGELFPYLFKPWKLGNRPVKYHARDMSTGAYLENGSAVMVTIPSICETIRKNRKKNAEKKALLPDGFMPMVALVDDPEDPQIVKLIASRSYYRRADREVDLLSYDIKPVASGSFPNWMDEFNWLRGTHAAEAEIGFDKRLYFRNEYLTGMPADMFRAANPDDVPIDSLKKPTFLYDLPGFKYPKDPTGKNPYGIEFPFVPGFGLFSFPFFSVNFTSETYVHDVSYDHVIPIHREGEQKTYYPDQKGYLLLYRQDTSDNGGEVIVEREAKTDNVLSRTRRKTIILRRGGVDIPLTNEIKNTGSGYERQKGSFFYDPETRYVYLLRSQVIKFPDI